MLILYKNRSIGLINTKLKLANNKIQQQQEMVDKYVLILSTDLKGIIIDVNEAYCKVLGFEKKELLGKTHSIIRHPLTTEDLISNIWTTIESDKTWIGKVQNYTKNKETRYFNLYIEPLYNNGVKIGYRSISEDITYRHELEELNEYQKSLLTLFEKGDAVLFKYKNNTNMDIEYLSESIYELTGYKKEDFLSRKISYSSCIHKDDLTLVYDEINNVIKNKLTYFKHEPYRIITKNGKEKWLLSYIVTLNDSNKDISHFLTYITDITEHIEQQRMLFQQSRTSAIGEMIGNIAHQWRQPLSVISTVSTGLKLTLEFEENIDKKMMISSLDKINYHTQHLSTTIDDFRSFFTDDLTVVKSNNLKDTIRKVRELSIDSFNNNFIEYFEDIESFPMTYNENIFIQALLNIYNNAKDALSDKKYDRYFSITVEKNMNSIVLKIRDNGGGIKEDVIGRIFEPYFTTKYKSVGTGIGLYMTNQIITKQLKGSISVNNVEFEYKEKTHKGVEFTLTLNI
jgi:PAS domain S-box-containing protein